MRVQNCVKHAPRSRAAYADASPRPLPDNKPTPTDILRISYGPTPKQYRSATGVTRLRQARGGREGNDRSLTADIRSRLRP